MATSPNGLNGQLVTSAVVRVSVTAFANATHPHLRSTGGTVPVSVIRLKVKHVMVR